MDADEDEGDDVDELGVGGSSGEQLSANGTTLVGEKRKRRAV